MYIFLNVIGRCSLLLIIYHFLGSAGTIMKYGALEPLGT